MVGFTQFIVAQVPRVENRMVDALANLASTAPYPCHVELSIMDHPSICNAAILIVEDHVGNSWISPISDYLRNGTLPTDKREVVKVRARVARYTMINDILYKRSFSTMPEVCPTRQVEMNH